MTLSDATKEKLKKEGTKIIDSMMERIYKLVAESNPEMNPVIKVLAMVAVKGVIDDFIENLRELPNDLRILVLEGLLEYSYSVQRIIKDDNAPNKRGEDSSN